MMYSNVIVDSTIFRGSFIFSQSRVKIPASLPSVGSLAVGAFALCPLLGSSLSLTLVSNCRNVVVGLWVTRML